MTRSSGKVPYFPFSADVSPESPTYWSRSKFDSTGSHPEVSAFFQGLSSRQEVEHYLGLFQKYIWEAEVSREAYVEQAFQGETELAIERGPHEQTIREAALAYARLDFAAAQRWIMENGHGGDWVREARHERLVVDFGQRYPHLALLAMSRVDMGTMELLVAGIVAGDPQRSKAVLSAIQDLRDRQLVASMARKRISKKKHDFSGRNITYPEPGMNLRLMEREEYRASIPKVEELENKPQNPEDQSRKEFSAPRRMAEYRR